MRRATCSINGAALKAIREATGLSHPALVDRIRQEQDMDVHKSTICRIENGRRQTSPELRRALAQALRVDIAAIAGSPTPGDEPTAQAVLA